jgi:hypothetical protein
MRTKESISTFIYRVKILAKIFIPRPLWNLLKQVGKVRSYQGVNLNFQMSRIHLGEFSNAHEKFARLDKHLQEDTEKTRLRTYTATSFCNLALGLTKSDTDHSGDVVTAGISFGTAPLIACELLREKLTSRKIYLIDPFLGVENSSDSELRRSYNENPELVLDRMPKELEVSVIKEFLSPEVAAKFGPLAFVHLNTNDLSAEKATIPIFYEKLKRGGVIVFDLYGWLSIDNQLMIDDMLTTIGAESMEQVTRQLIIFKS